MKNTMKEDWKWRINPKTVAVIVVPLMLIALWWAVSKMGTSSMDTSSADASFGGVFQIDPGQLGSIRVYGNGKLTTYTERADMEAFVEHLRGFRYTESEHLLAIVEMIGGIQFYDGSGHRIGGLGLGPQAVLTEDNILYTSDEPYFEKWFD